MKIATRYLLPLEIFMSLQMLSWGISGWVGGGTLWQALEKVGQNTEWGLALCLVGMVQLLATGLEWVAGRRWPNLHLLRSVFVRQWSAFACVVVWLYACYLAVTLPHVSEMFVLLIQAPAGVLFSVWIWGQNLKVACVLDPAVPTSRLQRELELERDALHTH